MLVSAKQGFDYAWGYTSRTPAALKEVGASFVVRYVGDTSKCITPAERDALHVAGLTIGLVFETTGNTFKGGATAGRTDGAIAAEAATKLGAPAGTIIWFAIDTATTDYISARAYLAGAQAACAPYNARLYADFYVIEAVGGTDHWQTYAWSGGKISKHASLYQYHNGVTIGGVDMDRCELINGGPGDGWWFHPYTTTPAPVVKRHWWNPKTWAVTATIPVVDAAAVSDLGKAIDHNRCLVFVRGLYGLPADGHAPTAAAGWAEAKFKHPRDANPPAGVPVWWTGGDGHVAISLGSGRIISSDIGPGGTVAEVALSEIHVKWGLAYAGWSEDIESKRIYTP
jgi:hypothetical protein